MAAIGGVTPEAVWARLRRDWCGNWRDEEWGIENGETGRGVGDGNKVGEKDWFEQVASRREQLEARTTKRGGASTASLVVLVAEAEPLDFLAGFWAGVLAGWTVAIANPNWTTPEWQSTYRLIDPDVVWGSAPILLTLSASKDATFPLDVETGDRPSPLPEPSILIPTGGTSGQLKFAHHTWATLTAAVRGFCSHFQPDNTPINTCCVLPLYHVSGLMQALRTWLTNGQLFIIPFKSLLSPSSLLSNPPAYAYLSLVPTQLSRLLAAGQSPWLRQCHAVLLGGAPPWPALLDQAKTHQIPVCLSYGMTETGAMVTAMRSQDFDPSNLSSGRALPHAAIRVENGGRQLPTGEIGQIVVTSSAIAHGYHNAPSSSFAGQTFYTDDLGYLDDSGQLHITGRASGKIISGGENIFPAEVEAALRRSGQVLSVCVVGLPDADWGEAVSAAYVPAHRNVSIDSLKVALDKSGQLSRYKYPKRWFALGSLPENAQGKINRPALLAQLASHSADSQ